MEPEIENKEILETIETIEESKVQETEQKLSYEQLHEIAVQASQQAEMFQRELIRLKDESLYIRLDFLFKVVANKEAFNSTFSKKCSDEIELLMTIPDKK